MNFPKYLLLMAVLLALGFLLGVALETVGTAKTAGVLATVMSLTSFGAIAWFRFRPTGKEAAHAND